MDSHKTVSTKTQPFRRERRAETVSNRGPSAYQPNALPLGQTGSHHINMFYRGDSYNCRTFRDLILTIMRVCTSQLRAKHSRYISRQGDGYEYEWRLSEQISAQVVHSCVYKARGTGEGKESTL